ncbi:MAG: hypothetical protein H0Z33_03270 [Bacillaceae bacterium]|nr:hypothetical protein [Bacillaceae bacterium]
MKPFHGLIALITISLLIVVVTLLWPENEDSEIQELNEHSYFGGIQMLTGETEVIDGFGEGEFVPGMGGYGRNYRDIRLFAGFSDDPDNRAYKKVSVIHTSNPAHHVFGIGIGDHVSKSEKILKNNHYYQQSNGIWSKDELFIDFKTRNLTIEEIRVWFIDKNLRDRLY